MAQIFFIGGNEPYLVDCQVRTLIGKLAIPELNLLEATAFSEDVVFFLNTFPVGDKRKVAYLTVNNISEMDIEPFHLYRLSAPEHAVLVVRFRDFDARRTFYKELSKAGMVQLFDKNSAVPRLASFIEKRAGKKGATFASKATLELFLTRENYANCEEITLYNIMHDLDSLIALGSTITEEIICSIIPERIKDNKYGIAKMINEKDVNGLRKQATLLKGSEIETLSALLREYRIAYKAKYYPLKDIGVTYSLFLKKDKQDLLRAIDILVDTIDALKRGTVPTSSALESVFFRLI